MKSTLLLLMLCAILSQELQTAFAQEACNEYVDKVIEDLKNDKEYMQDPYDIPEKTVEVHKKVIFVNYTGEAGIYDGHVFGLSTLSREGDVVVDHTKKTKLKVWLSAGVLKLKCSGKVKLMNHGPKVTVEAKADLITAKLDITPTENANPKITHVSIEDAKGLDVKVTGLGPLKFFLKPYVKVIKVLFKGVIRHFIESKLTLFLDKRLKEYEIPKECLEGNLRRSLK